MHCTEQQKNQKEMSHTEVIRTIRIYLDIVFICGRGMSGGRDDDDDIVICSRIFLVRHGARQDYA